MADMLTDAQIEGFARLAKRAPNMRVLLADYEALRAENKALRHECERTYCAYCGAAFELSPPEVAVEAVTVHIKTCLKHPMRVLEAECEALRRRVAAVEAMPESAILERTYYEHDKWVFIDNKTHESRYGATPWAALGVEEAEDAVS